jgi:hypothetical protein
MINFNVNSIVEEHISPRLRKTFTLELFKMICSPMISLYTRFYQFYEDKKYELTFNGQVIYLEHLLNDQFDNISRGIYISDSPEFDEDVVFFLESENNEETVFYLESEGEAAVVFYQESEIQTWPDFIVNVPAAVTFNEIRMKAYLNKYKLASKNYIIQIV